MESTGALPSGGLVSQLVCRFHKYWAYSSKSTVRPKMESCFQDRACSVSSFNFICILDYGKMSGIKQIWAIFFSKCVVKQQRQLEASTTHLAQKLLMNVQCRGCSRSFTKEKRALKMMSVVASHWKLTINWEQSSKLILLQQHERLPKNSALTILWSFDIWSKLERWKSLVSRCLLSWPQIKKIILKCCLLLFYATTVNHFLIGL